MSPLFLYEEVASEGKGAVKKCAYTGHMGESCCIVAHGKQGKGAGFFYAP